MDGYGSTVSYCRVFPAKNSIKRIKLPKVKSIQRGYASDPETRTLVRHHHHHRFREFPVGKDMFNQGYVAKGSQLFSGEPEVEVLCFGGLHFLETHKRSENRPYQTRKQSSSKHPFSEAKTLVSGSVINGLVELFPHMRRMRLELLTGYITGFLFHLYL